MDKDLIRSVEAMNHIDDIVAQFLGARNVDISHTPKGKKRLAANQRAKDILAKYDDDYSNVTEEDKQSLREYTGFGGIGNPPYGVRDSSALSDKGYKDLKYADQYFVTRSIDKAKAVGLITLVLPTRIVDSSSLRKWRVKLSLKAEFLGAHRLPTGVFADTGVVTDLVIWRKHHGTTIIHHLSLPWTLMSITQRNGRGARVGSKQDSVQVFFYVSKGSFDQFRLTTIQRKANWVETMFKGDDDFMANADADTADETAVMLAADPEETKRRIAANKLAANKLRSYAKQRSR